MNLYPMKFTPISKHRIWGGMKLNSYYRHDFEDTSIGETWDISALGDDDSEIANGFLEESTLSEAVEVYMEELLGEKVYKTYGLDFPLLVKLLDAEDKLSVQVHPNDEMAMEQHGENGKMEMWYVMEAEEGAEIILGFNRHVTADEFQDRIANHTLNDVLKYLPVKKGDVINVPPGCIHAIGAGIVICEIQQSSDRTYRVYDYDRKDKDGNPRELHIDLAALAIDYDNWNHEKIRYNVGDNEITTLVDADCFTTSMMNLTDQKEYVAADIESFILLTCVDGHTTVCYGDEHLTITTGETLLVPATMEKLILVPTVPTKILETYIK